MSFNVTNFNYLPQFQKDVVFGYNRNCQELYHIETPIAITQMITLYFSFHENYLQHFIKKKEKYFTIKVNNIKFPKPSNININMMPFKMMYEFSQTKLPPKLSRYWFNIIKKCMCLDHTQIGKIGFLTIHESQVEPNKTQRTPRIHTESPGTCWIKGAGSNAQKVQYDNWGRGSWTTTIQKDGIYIASSISESCAVWPCKIVPYNKKEIIGTLGDVEHLKSFLPKKTILQKNCVYWITDRTPHESLILSSDKKVYRQFFRLVTHKLSRWHEAHCTKNPNGLLPNPKITHIVKENKFIINNIFNETNYIKGFFHNDMYSKYMDEYTFPPNAAQLQRFAKYYHNTILSWKECVKIVKAYQNQYA
eukprot:10961_1